MRSAAAAQLADEAPPGSTFPLAADVAAWLTARVVADAGASALAFDVFHDYRDWLERWPIARPLAAAAFHQALDAHGFARCTAPVRRTGEPHLVRPGLRLTHKPIERCPPPKGLRFGRPGVAEPKAEIGRLRHLLGRCALQLDRAAILPGDPIAADILRAAGGAA